MTPDRANSSIPPESQVPQHAQDAEIWEAPFERWMKLADDLLEKWPLVKPLREDFRSLHS